jgi:hypothetical protein
MQLVQADNARTYHTKNSLDVGVANGNDKRGYTVVLALAASGKMLPLQVIYGGAEGNLRALPNVLCRATAAAKGFVFAQTPTHWSNQGSVRIYCTPSPLRYALTNKDRLEVELLCSVV